MRRRAAWQHLRRNLGTTAILFFLGVFLAVAVTAVSATRLSAEHAVSDSLRADLGGRAYTVQSGDPAVAAALRSVDAAALVADDSGAVSNATQGLRLGVTLRLIEDPQVHLGVLVSGQWPRQSGEALLSDAAARAIGLQVGDRAFVSTSAGDLDVTITGLTVDPADITTRTAVVVVPQDFALTGTRWLIDAPFAVAALEQPLRDRRASVQSVTGLLEGAANATPMFAQAMRHLPWAAGFAVGLVLAAFAALRFRSWSAYTDTLVDAGMAHADAWRTIMVGVVLTVVAGLAAGAGLALGVLMVLRVTVSAWFGQRWVTTVIPSRALLALALVAVVLIVVMRFPPRTIWGRLGTLIPRAAALSRGSGRFAQIVMAVALAAWASLTAAAGSAAAEGFLWLLPLLAALIVVAAPFALAPLVRMGLGPAMRAICRDVTGGLAVIAAAAALIALSSGVWAAQAYRDAAAGETSDSPMQPTGSYLIDRLPDAAMPALRRMYEASGGRAVTEWRLPDESRTNLRVTSLSLLRCLEQAKADRLDSLPEECFPQEAASPVTGVMIGPTGSGDVVDPDLLEDGRVGLLLFGDKGVVIRSSTVTAAADPALGGLAPGLVVNPDGPIARAFDLRPIGMSEVALLDFSRLDSRARLTVRAEVARLAPSAQTSDGTDPTAYERLRSTGDLAAILGAAAAAVVLALGLGGVVTARAATRRTLVDLGGTARLRLSLLGRWLLLPALCAILTAAVTVITATYGLHSPVGALGVSWLFPSVALLTVSGLAVPAFLSVPDGDVE